VTLGNHSFDQREAMVFIARQPRLVRPANYPPGTPGRGATVVETQGGARVLVVNVMGRVFLDPMDDPFTAVERELTACPLGAAADAVIVDVHAEATSEKQAFGHYLDGRASLVVGTHTHTPTADHRILPGGTAYMSDAGMCGDYDSVIGMQKDEPIRRMIQKTPGSRWEVAVGEGTLCGIAVETDARGLATRVAALRLGPNLEETAPHFWD
jgi:2',3'-cyclic-nucleotide 2'-phosphodiesterase